MFHCQKVRVTYEKIVRCFIRKLFYSVSNKKNTNTLKDEKTLIKFIFLSHKVNIVGRNLRSKV